jgi:hypothetical protein
MIPEPNRFLQAGGDASLPKGRPPCLRPAGMVTNPDVVTMPVGIQSENFTSRAVTTSPKAVRHAQGSQPHLRKT